MTERPWRLEHFRKLQLLYAQGFSMQDAPEKWLLAKEKADPRVWRQIVLAWLGTHPDLADLSRFCDHWYPHEPS